MATQWLPIRRVVPHRDDGSGGISNSHTRRCGDGHRLARLRYHAKAWAILLYCVDARELGVRLPQGYGGRREAAT